MTYIDSNVMQDWSVLTEIIHFREFLFSGYGEQTMGPYSLFSVACSRLKIISRHEKSIDITNHVPCDTEQAMLIYVHIITYRNTCKFIVDMRY